MRSRASVTHLTKTAPQTPPAKAVSTTKSKKQPSAAQPSGQPATDNEENE